MDKSRHSLRNEFLTSWNGRSRVSSMKYLIFSLVVVFLLTSLVWAETWSEPDSATAKELTALNTKLVKAYEEEDIVLLKELLAEDHVHNNVFGSVMDKDTFLKDIESGILEFVKYETPELKWMIGNDLAVATGLIEAQAIRAGKPVPATKFRFTRIFVRRNDQWKVLLFQNTMEGTPPKPE